MKKQVEILVSPEMAGDEIQLRRMAAAKAGIAESEIRAMFIRRRSIDARRRPPMVQLRLDLYLDEMPPEKPSLRSRLQNNPSGRNIIIVGAGPAGYFAALELIELGFCPIILDRGKDVQARRRDLRQIQQFGKVNPHSNYCFGEGGAGTYSDGKLYTRSHKRGNISKVLHILVEHGAGSDILIDAHPHIGSNKLPQVVQEIRNTILNFGGQIHFDSHVDDLIIRNGRLEGVVVNAGKEFLADSVILATGHSARDIFHLLEHHKIGLEAKSFAIGVRIEHPQPLIDRIQYGSKKRGKLLPAAAYKLACQVDGRGVFSFCMCPGGWIVPSSTAPGELVINGMSLSKRDNEFANSGIVVAVELPDLQPYREYGNLAGLHFQAALEKAAFEAGGDDTQRAPAQRMIDFVEKKDSQSLGATSYIPGIIPGKLHEVLPKDIARRLAVALKQFGRQKKGFYTNEAQLLAIESRTSSPVRIPRNRDSYMHEDLENLYPCGEGAGYAGGIVSAALDGQNVARAIARRFNAD